MWVAKFKVWHADSAAIECSREFPESQFLTYYLNNFDERGETFINKVAITSGPHKNELLQRLSEDPRLVSKHAEIAKMQRGDVLVSIATTPDLVTAMWKAGAIVMDLGGLTCHAAIVSRELGIPCVVGTRVATKVFKDGDVVEVSADNGLVRKTAA